MFAVICQSVGEPVIAIGLRPLLSWMSSRDKQYPMKRRQAGHFGTNLVSGG